MKAAIDAQITADMARPFMMPRPSLSEVTSGMNSGSGWLIPGLLHDVKTSSIALSGRRLDGPAAAWRLGRWRSLVSIMAVDLPCSLNPLPKLSWTPQPHVRAKRSRVAASSVPAKASDISVSRISTPAIAMSCMTL